MLRGVLPIVQTPFHDDGSLDLESLAREARYVCDAGAPGMAFPGFASEWWKLTEAEILAAAAVLRRETRGRAALILNITAQCTEVAVGQARTFQELGCDALMCLPPFVVPCGPAEAETHLAGVLEATPLPLVVQYSASLTGTRLELEQLLALRRRYRNLSCVKVDFIPPGPMLSALAELFAGEAVTYLVGFAGLQLPDSLRRGAHGLMGGAGHVAEDLAAFRALQEDPVRGREEFHRLLPLLNFEMQTVGQSIAVHKRLLWERGVIASDYVRAPGARLGEREVEELGWVAGSGR